MRFNPLLPYAAAVLVLKLLRSPDAKMNEREGGCAPGNGRGGTPPVHVSLGGKESSGRDRAEIFWQERAVQLSARRLATLPQGLSPSRDPA